MFITNKINENLYIITELDDGRMFFSMQLVIGQNKAALIDAGLGKDKSLYNIIRKLTALPVVLYITHAHGDHIGNAALFNEIHLSQLDDAMFLDGLKYTNIENGEIIDLGGVVLEAYALPGHTDGCFCFLNKSEKYALTGDSINTDTWLCWDTCAYPSEYADTIEQFNKKIKEYKITDIFDGHSIEALPKNICEDMITALRQLGNGETNNDRAHHFEDGKIKYQHIYGDAKIIYDKERCL